jgi:cell division protein ZapA (FtsZ GTPase activity inhibitor)
MSQSQSAVVTIFGKTYTLSTEGHDIERMRETAQLVDTHMREAAGEDPSSPVQVAVLAGLNLVDELFALQTEYISAESDIALRTSRLTASLGRLFEQVEAESDG